MDPYRQHRDAMYNFIVDAIDDDVFDRDQNSDAAQDGNATLSENFRTYQ